MTPTASNPPQAIVAEVRDAELRTNRNLPPLKIIGEIVVFLEKTAEEARVRKERLDERAGREYQSDAHIFVGTAVELADLIADWNHTGIQGFRLRPGTLPHDLSAITNDLVPELQKRDLFRTAYEEGSLRNRFGLARPANRYATAVKG